MLSCALLGIGMKACRAQDQPPANAKPEEKKQEAPAAPQAPAQPAAPAAPAPGTVTLSGLLDWYYGLNTRAPDPPFPLPTTSGTFNIDNVGRFNDINSNTPSFSLGELNFSRTPGKGFPLGITATFTLGDSARLFHATEPGGADSWYPIQQAYLTYPVHVKHSQDITIDFGGWVSPFGLEVMESSSNDQYSRGFLFQYAVPFYHAGLRVGVPLGNTLALSAALVNGWNNFADDNNAKSGYLELTWKPNALLTANLGYMGGSEGTGAYGPLVQTDSSIDTNFVDFNLSYQITSQLKVAGWANYGSGAGSAIGPNGNSANLSGTWDGFALYGRYQVGPSWAVAVRGELFEDHAGVGGLGIRTGIPNYGQLTSLTGTLEYTTLRGHLVSRIEYRHDHSNAAYFGTGSGQLTAQDQDTITFGQVY
jgi:hypothetical protein